jgi:ABC-type bacteriocin/lantibiotic exporter with double-glycine peptidase domain
VPDQRAWLADELRRFDFTWFIPAVVKYRRLLGEVLLASFFVQLFALITPILRAPGSTRSSREAPRTGPF